LKVDQMCCNEFSAISLWTKKHHQNEEQVVAAANTWIFAINHMKRAFRGRVDADTWNHIERIGKESENFLNQLTSPYRPSDKDFPRVVYNNRSGTLRACVSVGSLTWQKNNETLLKSGNGSQRCLSPLC